MLRPCLRALSRGHAPSAVSFSGLLQWPEPCRKLLSFHSGPKLAEHRGGRSAVQDRQAGALAFLLLIAPPGLDLFPVTRIDVGRDEEQRSQNRKGCDPVEAAQLPNIVEIQFGDHQ